MVSDMWTVGRFCGGQFIYFFVPSFVTHSLQQGWANFLTGAATMHAACSECPVSPLLQQQQGISKSPRKVFATVSNHVICVTPVGRRTQTLTAVPKYRGECRITPGLWSHEADGVTSPETHCLCPRCWSSKPGNPCSEILKHSHFRLHSFSCDINVSCVCPWDAIANVTGLKSG